MLLTIYVGYHELYPNCVSKTCYSTGHKVSVPQYNKLQMISECPNLFQRLMNTHQFVLIIYIIAHIIRFSHKSEIK